MSSLILQQWLARGESAHRPAGRGAERHWVDVPPLDESRLGPGGSCSDPVNPMEQRGPKSGERFDAALEEMGKYFVGSSALHKAAHAIARRLDEMGISYAIAGALCLAAHGAVRATEDVDVLITAEGLRKFK